MCNKQLRLICIRLWVFAGFIQTLMTLGIWVPLSSLSFACYLIHPLFILTYLGWQETPIHYTDLNFVSNPDMPFHPILFLNLNSWWFSSDVLVLWPPGALTGGERRPSHAD